MQLSNFVKWVNERFPEAAIATGATETDLKNAEQRLGIRFPDQVRAFYGTCDGVSFPQPFLCVLPLSELRFIDDSQLLRFCLVADQEEVAFDTSRRNDADQWFIKGVSEGYTITLTMASFWSQKLRGWLERGRPIWSVKEYAGSSG